MIQIHETNVVGLGAAFRGMRNPLESWDQSDGVYSYVEGKDSVSGETVITWRFTPGKKDLDLAIRLIKAGPSHCKFRRMIAVYMDVTAPLYWWKEFDTYKVGSVTNSCSTMHKITSKPFDISMFSTDCSLGIDAYDQVVRRLNYYREQYLKTGDKEWWYSIIQLLPSGWNQRRTFMVNYEILANVYETRRTHKLYEWRKFCTELRTLPYPELISPDGFGTGETDISARHESTSV